ncbi:MAG: hypothetical protein WD847_06115 [Pirellulales bacterium]
MRCWTSQLTAAVVLGAACLLAGGEKPEASSPESSPLSNVPRRIQKEPRYQAEKPLYGLYVFGPEAATRVWAVLDKSSASSDVYDVLHFDRNANGDLTDPGEEIAGEVHSGAVEFTIGDFEDAAAGQVHTDVKITRRAPKDGSVFLHLLWNGKEPVRGGYAEQSGPYTQFTESVETAPVLWPSAEGPFSFQRWISSELSIGGSTDVRVFMGHQGIGKNTFCAVTQTFLPEEVPVLATLIYTDSGGQIQRLQSELRQRC